jgi:sialic acid synthase SpsE
LFSTPFDETSVDFLEKMSVPVYKVASFESGDLALLRKIGATKKPVIMARGMTSLDVLERALKTLREAGATDVAVLHCVSSYPAVPEQMHLQTIPDIARRFSVVAGLSDHMLGTTVSLVSVALGACIIEKHFTLRRADGGPDAGFSLEPEEMADLVRSVREAEKAIGEASYDVEAKEKENFQFRRSLFVVKDVKRGEIFSAENVRCIRPGQGLDPMFFPQVLGAAAACDLERGTPLAWEHVVKKEDTGL